ncbi:hypothetical protein BY996DRAFT_6411122 [Phakopsora pachyrhizi]|nr:hypothetical protein BY996DRAFT_6411122 [Phakopsora pachyrhizi]
MPQTNFDLNTASEQSSKLQFLLQRLKKDVDSELPDKAGQVFKCKMTALEMKSTKTIKVHKVIWTDVGNGAKGAIGGIMKAISLWAKILGRTTLSNGVRIFHW